VRTLCLTLAFDGTAFHGWQRQKNSRTVQGEVEQALLRIIGQTAVVHGAGRTDAGVHALGMTASFCTFATISCAGLAKGLNAVLASDIRVLAAREMADGFHARKSARAKTYQYHIRVAPVQLPTERLYSLHQPSGLDLKAMTTSLACLEGEHDFSSFEGAGSRDPEKSYCRGAVRRIFSASLTQSTSVMGTHLIITLTGDGFLRHMVRNIVGTLLLVGRNKMGYGDFTDVLAAKDRSRAGPTAPAHGLFLQEVLY